MDRLADRRVHERGVREQRPRERDARAALGAADRRLREEDPEEPDRGRRDRRGGPQRQPAHDRAASVAASMNEHRCHADTVNVNAANAVYIRSVRDRSSTDAPIARISSAASSAETAWTSTRAVYAGPGTGRPRPYSVRRTSADVALQGPPVVAMLAAVARRRAHATRAAGRDAAAAPMSAPR